MWLRLRLRLRLRLFVLLVLAPSTANIWNSSIHERQLVTRLVWQRWWPQWWLLPSGMVGMGHVEVPCLSLTLIRGRHPD